MTVVVVIFVAWIVTRDVIVTVIYCILAFMTGIVVTWKELLVPLWSKSWQRQASTRARHSIYTQQSFMAVFSIVFPPAHPQEARVGIHQVGRPTFFHLGDNLRAGSSIEEFQLWVRR